MNLQSLHPADRGDLFLALRRDLLRLEDEARLLRRDLLRRKYNPDQPRVPSGDPTGGQWTSGGGGSGFDLGVGHAGPSIAAGDGGLVFDESGEAPWSSYSEGFSADGSIFQRDIANRDGSAIHSEYAASRAAGFDERQTVTLTSGETVSFETTDRTQTIRYGGSDGAVVSRSLWTPSGPEADATVQPAFAPMVAAPAIIIGGAILYNWQSPFDGGAGRQAVMGFEARDFAPRTGAAGNLQLSYVGTLTEDEVEQACLRLPDVKSFADRAANAVGPSNGYSSAAVYGTHVHTRFQTYVEDQRDPDFRAERSFLKEVDDGRAPGDIYYSLRGTVRVDAYEYRDDGTLCVYDLKTGKAGMSDRRAEILATAAARGFKTRRVIMSVIRPKR